ncbi:MAG TPA: hypothetical protein VGE52_13650, partial [Pirellulales bacterium]
MLRRDADATGVLLRVDRDHGFTASKLHADLKFHSAFTTSARNLLLTRRDGDDVVVVELGPADRLREVRYEGYAKEADSECSGGPTEDRLAFTTNEGTVLCRFPGKQRVVESSQYLCDWRTHPSRELVAFTMFEGETQQLGFCLVSDGKLSWLTPLLETSCMIHSYAFAWDGRVVGLILHDGERVDTALYEFPSFAHLYRTTRNWDNRVDVKKRSLEGGIAF